MTKKTETTKKSNGNVPTTAIVAGVLAAGTAAAAGYYFYGAKHAKKHRKQAAAWAHTFKTEVVKEAKKVKAFDERVIRGVVDRVASTFSGEGMDADSLAEAAQELKDNWRKIQKELESKAGKRVMKRRTLTKKAS